MHEGVQRHARGTSTCCMIAYTMLLQLCMCQCNSVATTYNEKQFAAGSGELRSSKAQQYDAIPVKFFQNLLDTHFVCRPPQLVHCTYNLDQQYNDTDALQLLHQEASTRMHLASAMHAHVPAGVFL